MFNYRFFILLFSLLFILPVSTLVLTARINAQSISPTPTNEQLKTYFRNLQVVENLDIEIPTVIEMPLYSNTAVSNRDFLVIEAATNEPQPFIVDARQEGMQFTAFNVSTSSPAARLNDSNFQTFESFQISSNTIDDATLSEVILRFDYRLPITTTQLNTNFDNNVQVPRFITIQARDEASDTYSYVINRSPFAQLMAIPQTSSDSFLISLEYDQPLRITEMGFQEQSQFTSYYLRFLARPKNTYHIYSSPEGDTPFYNRLSGSNLQGATLDVLSVDPPPQTNPSFQPPDRDGDGVLDTQDNCPNEPNPDQADVNSSKRGDACEDFDLDGVMNTVDNCPDHPNPIQQDEDGDGVGDHCDGIESRLIERLSFLPWLGIALGFGVVIVLFKTTMKSEKQHKDTDLPPSDNTHTNQL